MKLEVGMYVRFKDKRGNTYIRKIIDIPKDNRYASIYIDKEANYTNHLSFKNVLKASDKIIDLIEVGDYVNGVMVESMNNSIKPIPIPQYKNECGEYIDFDESDIKSIVTSEQFSAMEYRLGGK